MTTGIAEKKVKLGNTGLMVTPICFGMSPLSNMPHVYGYGVTDDEVSAAIKAMFASPINFMDTSRGYGRGRSETDIGNVLKEIGGLPEGYVLATKLDKDFDTAAFDAAAMRRSLEASLKALGLDRIQIMHLHDPEYAPVPSDVTKKDGAIAELFKMKEEGIVGAVGLAAGTVDVMMPMLRNWDFDVMLTHNRFTLVNRNAEEMIDLAISRGTAVLNAAPYGSGVLAKGTANFARYAYKDAPESVLGPIREIEAICARYNVPTGAAALQFSMRDPRITSTVVGMTKPERIQQTLEWADLSIPQAAWDELLALPFSRANPQAG